MVLNDKNTYPFEKPFLFSKVKYNWELTDSVFDDVVDDDSVLFQRFLPRQFHVKRASFRHRQRLHWSWF